MSFICYKETIGKYSLLSRSILSQVTVGNSLGIYERGSRTEYVAMNSSLWKETALTERTTILVEHLPKLLFHGVRVLLLSNPAFHVGTPLP